MGSNGQLFNYVLIVSAVLHIASILYGSYHDAHSALKYTDVDYCVFSDATRYVYDPSACAGCKAQGPLAVRFNLSIGDPYERATYRYTPLLSLLLLPNEIVHPAFGKVLFSFCDLLIGGLLYRILEPNNSRAHLWVGLLWLLNPIVINISTRGSAESVLGAIVISTLSLILKGRYDMGAAMLGLAVHFKIYPFIYGASVLAFLGSRTASNYKKEPNSMTYTARQFLSREGVRFAVVSLTTFITLNGIMYIIWGTPFLQHAYFYHLSRRDHRHNFSPYFYLTYLTYTSSATSFLRNPLLSFIPQMSLSIGTGLIFGGEDLPFAWFVQTMAFVTLNKVCTSQYFLWYIWFLPLVFPHVGVSLFKALWLVSIWVGAQVVWLWFAYQLEFLGKQVFFVLWSASIGVLAANSYVLVQIVRHYTPFR